MGRSNARTWYSSLLAVLALFGLLLGAGSAQAQDKAADKMAARPAATIKAQAPKGKAFDPSDCYECHEAVKDFHRPAAQDRGLRHCHGGLDTHRPRARAGRPPRPTPAPAAPATTTSTARSTT